ncbi:MAG: hypothetical protein ACRD2Y_07810, partial [Terriglobales bacterium]
MPTSPTNTASAHEVESESKKEPTKAAPALRLRELTAKPQAAKDSPKPHPKSKATARPTKILPTDRITFTRQLDILRAWAAISGPMGKIATNNAVADVVKMQASTVSMANAFLNSVGLLV